MNKEKILAEMDKRLGNCANKPFFMKELKLCLTAQEGGCNHSHIDIYSRKCERCGKHFPHDYTAQDGKPK